MTRVGIFLATVALIAGMVGCGGGGGVVEYDLTIASTEGGEVTKPGERTFTYDRRTDVDLIAEAEEGYQFVNWTGDVDDIDDVEDATTTITMMHDCSITAEFTAKQYDLTISSTAGGSVTTPEEGTFTYDYGTVVNLVAVAEPGYQFVGWTGDIDTIADVNVASTKVTVTDGLTINASFAREIRDWYDLGGIRDNLDGAYILTNGLDSTTTGYEALASPTANEQKGWQPINPFTGSLNGQGYEIRDLFINRPDEWDVGLFGVVLEGGVIENVGVVNADVTGDERVGGLVGLNFYGTVSNSYATASATGDRYVGCLVGGNGGTVSNSYSGGSVTGEDSVGGLVGLNRRGSDVSNSHYSYDEVLINGKSVITTGALFAEDFEQWLANDKFLDVSERLSQEDGYYVVSNVSDFKELLAFGQDVSLKFMLKADLDLATEPNLYIPYMAGQFDGNGYKISNLSVNFNFISQVGLFGHLAYGGEVIQVNVENVNINGYQALGSLVGYNRGTVSDSCATGIVTGDEVVGGLVGLSRGVVSNSHYDYGEVLINGQHIITVGALFNEDFEQWLANDKFLDVNERLSQEDGYYVVSNVSDFKELLAFGQDGSLKFMLKADLDLATEPNLYIPYMAGQFDGNGYKISNLSVNFNFISQVGLFGHLAYGGEVTQVNVENVNINGTWDIGGLVGINDGTMSKSSAAGDFIGTECVGGLVARNYGTVSDCSATGTVTGKDDIGGLVGINYDECSVSKSSAAGDVTGDGWVGGLVGENYGTVSDSSATASVTGKEQVGGLLGRNHEGRVRDSYSTGSVGGESLVGGLVGSNYESTVSNSYSTGTVTGDDLVGGLLGWNGWGSDVSNSSADGDVTGDGWVGGLVGENAGTVTDSYSTGSVTGKEQVGGLFGRNHEGTVNDSYSIAIVNGDTWVGGLVGSNYESTVSNCYATGSVSGDDVVGGLVGTNEGGTVSNSYSTGSVSGDDVVGGLVGWNDGPVSDSSAAGDVTGNSWVGGLVGQNDGTVSNCYATSSVTGKEQVGGLFGRNHEGTVRDSYSTGSVAGESWVGGLVGSNYESTVSNSYSTGTVTGHSSVGGLVGTNEGGTVSNSFWDTETSGQATSAGGTGKTTAEMQDIATFSGADWNIITVASPGTRNPTYVWNMVDGDTYPFLGWEP